MKKKFLELLEKEGFILLLFLCVCAVAGGTIFLSMRNLNTAKENSMDKDLVIIEDQQVRESAMYEMDPNESRLDSIETAEVHDEVLSDEKVKEVVEAEELDKVEVELDSDLDEIMVLATAEDEYDKDEELEFVEPEKEDVETKETVKESRKMELPLEGPIIAEYTKDALIYSSTLESWVGHNAIDIEAKEGTAVKATMDGTIKEVYEDELWGIVIVIDHGNELQTRYSNLSTKEMVKVGVNVKKGDHISKVGKTAKIEMLMAPHLHFEVIKNGKIIDPRSINK